MDKTAQRILRGIGTTGLCRCGGMDADNIEMEVNNWEKNRWRRDIDSKTTLVLYRSKRNMGDGGIYSNEYGSVLLFQCWTNTLKLRWRQGFEGGSVYCLLCGGLIEALCCWNVVSCRNKKAVWCMYNRSTGLGANVYGQEWRKGRPMQGPN